MPWMSVGLSARGKLRSAISLITLGKFSPGVGCTIVDRDVSDHAKNLNIYPWRKVWNKLADIWDNLTTRGYTTAVHKSWDRLALVMASKLEQVSGLHLLDLQTYTQSETSPMPIQLYFATVEDMELLSASIDNVPEEVLGVDEGVMVCQRLGPCLFELPEYIREIFIMQNYLNSPDIVLTKENGDYTVISDIQYGKKGEILFSSGVILNRYMWISVYREKKNQEMMERFGPEVGYNVVRADEYDTFCDLYFLRFLQSTGVSNRNLELGLTIMQNWPYARFRSIVQRVNGITSMEVLPYPPSALTENLVYEVDNDNGLPFQTLQNNEWVDLKPGDVIDAGTPVTAAVRCYDLKNKPELAGIFHINYLERFHKTVVAFNSNLDYLDDEWVYVNYVGVAGGFVIGDMIVGSTSGAWGYIIQTMHGGTTGRIELRRVVGTFIPGEPITDEHGNQAEMSPNINDLGNPHYCIDDDATREYLIRNKRTGSDFTTLVWINYAPCGLIHTTYGTLLLLPSGHIETDMMTLFSPSLTITGTAFERMLSPEGHVETEYGLPLSMTPDGHIETDYGMYLQAPLSTPSRGFMGGDLDYELILGHADDHFIANELVTGQTSGATAVVTTNKATGIGGILRLRHIRGIFQDNEVILGETAGDAWTDGVIH